MRIFRFCNPKPRSRPTLAALDKFVVQNAGVIAASFLTYPIDTVRRHLHLQIMLPAGQRTYRGALDCCEKIVAAEGISGLYAGFGVNMLRIVATAAVLVLYGEVTAARTKAQTKRQATEAK